MADDRFVLRIGMVADDEQFCVEKPSDLTNHTRSQLEEYFSGKRNTFDLPLAHSYPSTSFSKKVYDVMKSIPFGTTMTYKSIAQRIDSPKAYRPVGNCIGKNPHMIVVPCHRVLTSSGKIGGYVFGKDVKRALLNFEHALPL